MLPPPALPTRRAALAIGAALALVSTLAWSLPARAVPGSAFVRVNQVGYAAAASKRAYLMSSVAEPGAIFTVRNGATTAFSGPIGLDLGSWSSSFPHVYALDFSSVSTTGTYSIEVTGPVAGTSPSFRIDAAAAV